MLSGPLYQPHKPHKPSGIRHESRKPIARASTSRLVSPTISSSTTPTTYQSVNRVKEEQGFGFEIELSAKTPCRNAESKRLKVFGQQKWLIKKTPLTAPNKLGFQLCLDGNRIEIVSTEPAIHCSKTREKSKKYIASLISIMQSACRSEDCSFSAIFETFNETHNLKGDNRLIINTNFEKTVGLKPDVDIKPPYLKNRQKFTFAPQITLEMTIQQFQTSMANNRVLGNFDGEKKSTNKHLHAKTAERISLEISNKISKSITASENTISEKLESFINVLSYTCFTGAADVYNGADTRKDLKKTEFRLLPKINLQQLFQSLNENDKAALSLFRINTKTREYTGIDGLRNFIIRQIGRQLSPKGLVGKTKKNQEISQQLTITQFIQSVFETALPCTAKIESRSLRRPILNEVLNKLGVLKEMTSDMEESAYLFFNIDLRFLESTEISDYDLLLTKINASDINPLTFGFKSHEDLAKSLATYLHTAHHESIRTDLIDAFESLSPAYSDAHIVCEVRRLVYFHRDEVYKKFPSFDSVFIAMDDIKRKIQHPTSPTTKVSRKKLTRPQIRRPNSQRRPTSSQVTHTTVKRLDLGSRRSASAV